jgi:hypothetical protein
LEEWLFHLQAPSGLDVKPKEVEIVLNGRKKVLAGEELNKWEYQRYMQDYVGRTLSPQTGTEGW